METGPAEDTHLEVRTMTNLRTNASESRDVAGPPPGAVSDGSADFAAVSPDGDSDLQRRLKEMEDQIAQLREEVRRLRREP